MNKPRITGLVLLIIGIALQFFKENDGIGFVSGALMGAGIGLLIYGKFGSKK